MFEVALWLSLFVCLSLSAPSPLSSLSPISAPKERWNHQRPCLANRPSVPINRPFFLKTPAAVAIKGCIKASNSRRGGASSSSSSSGSMTIASKVLMPSSVRGGLCTPTTWLSCRRSPSPRALSFCFTANFSQHHVGGSYSSKQRDNR